MSQTSAQSSRSTCNLERKLGPLPSRPGPAEIPELHLPEVSEGDFRFGSSLAGPDAAMATGGGAPRACCLSNAVIDGPRKLDRARRECPGPISALSIPQGSRHPGPHPSLSLERTPPSPPHSAGRSSAPEHAHSPTSPPRPDYVSQNALCTSPSASLPFSHPFLCFHPPPRSLGYRCSQRSGHTLGRLFTLSPPQIQASRPPSTCASFSGVNRQQHRPPNLTYLPPPFLQFSTGLPGI